MRASTVRATLLFGAVASAYDLPSNLKAIYDAHKSGECGSSLSGPSDSGAVYCGDIPNAIFLKGNNGYDNMDVDCDGANRTGGDCSNDPSGQDETAFKDTIQSYGIEDLDANLHSYVVFGTADYDPSNDGLNPLSIMAIVCNDQLFYGVWGDTNGFSSTGEASLSLAQLCFPDDGLTGDNGHDGDDVLYIGFTGGDAVPGANGANWQAGDRNEFQDSLKTLGDQLVAGLAA